MHKPIISLEEKSIPKELSWIFRVPKKLRDQLSREGKVIDVEPHQALAHRGATMSYLIVVISGEVKLHKNGLSPSIIGQGGTIGWLSVIDKQSIEVDVVCISKCRLLLIPIPLARDMLLNFPELTESVFFEMARALRQYSSEKDAFLARTAYQRVYMHILNLSKKSHENPSPIRIPKQDIIAKTINTSRETVSRAIQQLIKMGIVEKHGRNLQILKISELKRLSSEQNNNKDTIAH